MLSEISTGCKPNVAPEWLVILLHTRDIPGTRLLDIFRVFPQHMWCQLLVPDHYRIISDPSRSLFPARDIIQGYTIPATESVLSG